MMTKWMIAFDAIVLIIAVSAGLLFIQSIQHAKQNQEIKIGAIIPLTGSGSDQGQWQMNGLEIAKDEINSQGRKIELLYEDSKGMPSEAITAYNKIKSEAKIPAIITWGSGVGIALTQMVNDDHIIQMGIATASPNYSTPNDYTFRVFSSSSSEGAFDANLVYNRLGIRNISVIYTQNDYGIGSKTSFESAFSTLGGKIISEESVEPGTTDVRTQISKIKSKNPEAIFLAVYPKEGGIILKQADELGLKIKFIASTAILGGKEFFDIAGNSAEGLIVTTGQFDPDYQTNETRKFTEEYMAKYGTKPEVYAARAYDGLKVLAKTMETCNDNTTCVKDALYKISYQGATGVISFDNNGDIIANFQILTVKNQTFVRYQG